MTQSDHMFIPTLTFCTVAGLKKIKRPVSKKRIPITRTSCRVTWPCGDASASTRYWLEETLMSPRNIKLSEKSVFFSIFANEKLTIHQNQLESSSLIHSCKSNSLDPWNRLIIIWMWFKVQSYDGFIRVLWATLHVTPTYKLCSSQHSQERKCWIGSGR